MGDMEVWLYTIISVIVVSLISQVGLFTLSLSPERLQRITLYLVAFAVGGLFGNSFVHLLPEAFHHNDSPLSTSLLIVVGILIFFVLEKFLRWRHCHVTEHQFHHPVATLNLVSDALHNLIDGVLIAATFSVDIPLGITTTVAIILHEIPQEIGDFGVLVHSGMSVRKALLFNFLSASVALVGAIVVLAIGPNIQQVIEAMIPVTAGGFLYIAGSDLIPELQHDVKISNSLGQFICIILGVAVMAALALTGSHSH
ncbi:MAG: ZIP family metal transporter [candidate division Zixibacteria bacterium]|nr:ZIP family metal transporter [candidate division Zixibacteria bacterium]